jgi:hypothetical protein
MRSIRGIAATSDMHFLSCAAGYADFLLAEKATFHDLRRAERRLTPEPSRTPGSGS